VATRPRALFRAIVPGMAKSRSTAKWGVKVAMIAAVVYVGAEVLKKKTGKA